MSLFRIMNNTGRWYNNKLWLMNSDSFWPWALHSTGSAAAVDSKQRIRGRIRRTVCITAEITENKKDIFDFIISFTHLSNSNVCFTSGYLSPRLRHHTHRLLAEQSFTCWAVIVRTSTWHFHAPVVSASDVTPTDHLMHKAHKMGNA